MFVLHSQQTQSIGIASNRRSGITYSMTDDLQQLLRAIDAKDVKALQTLYDLYGSQVYSLAYSVVQNRETAEEVTQDVFMKVWKKVEQYELGTNFRAWILRIARNLAIDRLRRDKNHQQRTAVWDLEFFAAPNNFITDDARWVHRALKNLSDAQRQAIELAFLQGMTHQQIADHLETPLGTIKTRIRDGLRNLRDVWEGESEGSQ